jgi:hypothetical protein
VLRLTLLDNVSGLRWKHSNDVELRNINVEPIIMLDNGQVILSSVAVELFVVHRLKVASDKILSWVGLYRAVPNSINNRKGDYCGVGFWLLNANVAGSEAIRILRDLMTSLLKAMQASPRQSWDVMRAPLDSLARRLEDPPLRDFDGRTELGRETICIDVSRGDELTLEEALDEIQEGANERFGRFNRVLLTQDAEVVAAVEGRGRISVMNLADILRPPQARAPSRVPEDRPTRSPAPTRTGGATAPRPPVGDAANETARLSYELRQANARIDELTKGLRDTQARLAKPPKRSLTLPVLAGIALGLLAGFAAQRLSAVFGLPSPQALFGGQQSPPGKQADAPTTGRSERSAAASPQPRPTPSDAVDAGANPSSPANAGATDAPTPTPTAAPAPPAAAPAPSRQGTTIIDASQFRKLIQGGGLPYVLVDVDGSGKDRDLPGAVPCLSKPPRSQRCTVKDLNQVSRDGVLVFYGHGAHSVAPDLAAELAGEPNVYWYKGAYDDWRRSQGAVDDTEP